MGLQYEIAGNQIDGARDYQEDAYLITHLTNAEGQPAALVIVADGMGGHAAGNVASNMAVQAINKYITSNYPSDDITGLLQGGVLKANASIAETIRETPALQGMGCTMVGVLVEQERLWWASVGDSHLYLLRDKELTKKNADHSYGGFLDRLAAAGQPMEPEPGLSRNMLMSALTGDEITEIDCPEQPFILQPGDRLLLCSDGMDTLGRGKLIQYSEWSDKTKGYVKALLDAVDEAAMPRQDNTTAIVIDVQSQDATTESATPPEQAKADDGRGDTDEMDIIDIGVADNNADVTDTTQRKEPTLEETAAPAEQTPPAPPSPAQQQPEPASPSTDPSGNRDHSGLLAIAAGLLIAIAVGAGYVMLQSDAPDDRPLPESATDPEQPPPEPEVAETTPAPPASEPEPAPAQRPEQEPQASETPTAETSEAAPENDKAPVQPIESFRDTLRGGGEGPVMSRIPASIFMMGSSRADNERPQHEVEVPAFAISQHEITVGQYARYARATGNPMPSTPGLQANHPMVNVTWQQAVNYTRWLSDQTGHTYRLPTEAEWEYAATAGRDTTYWWGVKMEPEQAHCFGCNDGPPPSGPITVGTFPANPFGLHDTEGNVAEWVQDCWHENYDGAPATASTAWTKGGNCARRGVRGGSWSSPPASLRDTRRDHFNARNQYDHVGFRVVREVVREE